MLRRMLSLGSAYVVLLRQKWPNLQGPAPAADGDDDDGDDDDDDDGDDDDDDVRPITSSLFPLLTPSNSSNPNVLFTLHPWPYVNHL